MNLRSLLLAVVCAANCAALTGAAADQIYKWIDKDGKIHYSSTPPAATDAHPEKIDVQAAQGFSMPAPAPTQFPSQDVRPRRSADDKAKADAADKQIKEMWGQCQVIGQQLDDLRNDVSPNPVTHTKLTAAERAAREQMLEKQLKSDCPDEGS